MTYLLARLDAALTRVITCVADKVFGAIDAALFPGFDVDGADWLTGWEAEHEVHEPAPTYSLEELFKTRDDALKERLASWWTTEVTEPAPVNCPVGGECPRGCDRTHAGCHTIWGSDTEHAEAVERNRFYTSMKDVAAFRKAHARALGFGDLTVFDDDGTSRVIPAGEWYLEPTDDN